MYRICALGIAVILTFSCIIMVESTSAQSTYPAITEFTLKYADHSYDVSPTTTSSKDPYTGETANTTVPGYHVENKTVDVTIKNPSGATYYNFRWKGTFENEWQYSPYNPNRGNLAYFIPDGYSVPFQASKSAYSTFALNFLPKSITPGGSIDVQVQALYGSFRAEPYVHAGWVGAPTYDFYFEGETSDWSNTQTITIPESNTSPSPTSPMPTINTGSLIEPFPFPLLIVASVIIAVVILSILFFIRHRKTSMLSK